MQSPFLRSYSLRKISIAMKKVSSLHDDRFVLVFFSTKYAVASGTGIIDRGFRIIDNDPNPGNILRVVISRHNHTSSSDIYTLSLHNALPILIHCPIGATPRSKAIAFFMELLFTEDFYCHEKGVVP